MFFKIPLLAVTLLHNFNNWIEKDACKITPSASFDLQNSALHFVLGQILKKFQFCFTESNGFAFCVHAINAWVPIAHYHHRMNIGSRFKMWPSYTCKPLPLMETDDFFSFQEICSNGSPVPEPHRIVVCLGLEGTFKEHLVQPLCRGVGVVSIHTSTRNCGFYWYRNILFF